ncbi:peptidoglycan-binding protein, partial [Candidatus Gribaldobacteria bacterium]|nr:peptidoglycan-binding protein [Candidatus Gribaldobacteria bacterium]
TVNTSNAGPYTIRYNVKDSQGLSAEEKTRIVIVQEQSHSGGGGGGGGGSSSGGGAVILLNESNKGQDNLPTEPIEPTEPTGTGSLSRQCPLLLTYLRKGRNNPVEEVKKLQVFLRDFEGFNLLEISGVFDDATFSAVSEFQKRYGNEVLGEWGISDSTGYVYITTKNKVNEIYCQLEIPLTDDESAIILASRQNLSNLVDANQAGDSRKEEQSQNGSTESTSSLGFTIIGNGSNKDGENEGELSNDIKPSFFASLIGAFSQKLFKNIPLWLFFGLGLGLLLILFAVYYFVWRAKKKAMLLSQLLQSIQLK